MPADANEDAAAYYSGPALDGSRAGWFNASARAFMARRVLMSRLICVAARPTTPGPIKSSTRSRPGLRTSRLGRYLKPSRFKDGHFTTVTRTRAPITGVVPVLVLDRQGYVWVGIQSGAVLLRFHAGEMDKIEKDPRHRLAYTLYDESDGLQPGTQMWQSGGAGLCDLSGRVWVVNGPGVTIIDPQLLREPRRVSPPSIEAVTVNGERVNPASLRRVGNGSSVQLEYAALSLSIVHTDPGHYSPSRPAPKGEPRPLA